MPGYESRMHGAGSRTVFVYSLQHQIFPLFSKNFPKSQNVSACQWLGWIESFASEDASNLPPLSSPTHYTWALIKCEIEWSNGGFPGRKCHCT